MGVFLLMRESPFERHKQCITRVAHWPTWGARFKKSGLNGKALVKSSLIWPPGIPLHNFNDLAYFLNLVVNAFS